MFKLRRSLDDIDATTLERYRRDPVAFIEENLISPYTGKSYELIPAERGFIRHAFTLDANGRLQFPLWLFGAPKKSRKSELANLLTITTMLLFGGKYAEAYLVARDLDQAVARGLNGCRRICEASPLLKNEVKCTSVAITFVPTQATITAIPTDPAGCAGAHPVLSVFDEFWTASERVEQMFVELIPTPTKPVSARLVISHAGPDQGMLHSLYLRGMQQPELGENLRGGDGLLMHWSHQPMHPWQDAAWLEQMKRELPLADYYRKIENRFTPPASEFITAAMWDPICTLPDPPPHDPKVFVVIAVDASTLRDSTAIAVLCRDGDTIKLLDHKIFVPSAGDPIDFEFVERTILDYTRRFPNNAIVCDPMQMAYLMQRLKSAGKRVEEFKQVPANLSGMTMCLEDLVRYRKLHVYSNPTFRTAILNTVVETRSSGHRIIRNRNQKDHIDVVSALAMGSYYLVQNQNKSTFNWDVFANDFRDLDLPPLPEPEPPGPVRADGNWWMSQSRQPQSSGDDRLRAYYGQIDRAIQHGLYCHDNRDALFGSLPDNRSVIFRHNLYRP